jgi:methionyl-tRNA synthetase
MTLTFSAKPGPRERHLQRKLNNPLFVSQEQITQLNILDAQQKDSAAMQQFMEQFRDLVQRAVGLDKTVESEVILLLKAQLEQQYAVCTGLPGQPVQIQEAIRKLIAAISSTLRATSKDDPHALEKLDRDEEHTNLHLQLCEWTIVSDMLNPDEVISDDEKIAALLNEPEDALKAALALFPPDRTGRMVEEGRTLLQKIEADGHTLPEAWQRLAQMESWLKGK